MPKTSIAQERTLEDKKTGPTEDSKYKSGYVAGIKHAMYVIQLHGRHAPEFLRRELYKTGEKV